MFGKLLHPVYMWVWVLDFSVKCIFRWGAGVMEINVNAACWLLWGVCWGAAQLYPSARMALGGFTQNVTFELGLEP